MYQDASCFPSSTFSVSSTMAPLCWARRALSTTWTFQTQVGSQGPAVASVLLFVMFEVGPCVGVEGRECLSQQCMLLCYAGCCACYYSIQVDLCAFQVWRTRSMCPNSACYCAIVGLTCVYFKCGGQGASVPTVLCYSGVDLCVFQVWRTRNICPNSACYSVVLGLTCVYFRRRRQGASVPAVHVTVL